MRRRSRRSQVAHSNQDRWLVSYADFITLLFAFFTTMYAISTVDAQKLTKMVSSMQVALNGAETRAAPRAAACRQARAAPPPRCRTRR